MVDHSGRRPESRRQPGAGMPLSRGKAALATVVTLVLSSWVPTAAADPVVSAPDSESVSVNNSKQSQQRDQTLSQRRGWRPRLGSSKPRTFILDPRLVVGADGQTCVFVGQVE